jgi:SH3-like domain-containing protein
MPFIRRSRARPARLAGDPALVGGWVRVREATQVLEGPREDAGVSAELEGAAPLRVLAGAGSWYRVALPAGGEGWIPVRQTEPTSRLRDWIATERSLVRAGPHEAAPAVAGVEPGTALTVLGSYRGFAWVETPAGRRGWVSEEG